MVLPRPPAAESFSEECAAMVRDARQMFQRVLSGWVSDLLTLRRAGMHRPVHRGPRPEEARERGVRSPGRAVVHAASRRC